MKKILFVFGIALVAVSLTLIVLVTKYGLFSKIDTVSEYKILHPRFPVNGLSLNGISPKDADQMVSDFIDDHESSDPKTAIWLSVNWVNNVADLLKNEGDDGIRIYFAKKADNTGKKRNSILIVSTKNDGVDSRAETGIDHLDYFDHNVTFFINLLDPTTRKKDIQEDLGGYDLGATLFDANYVCPSETCNVFSTNYIECAEAQKAVLNFSQKSNLAINTDNEWFPIALIEGLKAELKAATASIPADGIRIYFAKNYDNPGDVKHKNRNTFIITTTKSAGNSHQDYHECYTSNKGTKDHGEECPNNCNGVTIP